MFGWGRRERDSNAKKSVELKKQNLGMPTVKFNKDMVTETIKEDLRQNIKQIAEIPPSDFDMVYKAALSSISKGRDASILYAALMNINGMKKSLASKISLSLNNKATALIEVERQTQLGIKYAIWRYSGAPCGSSNEAHKAADGKPYLVTKGMLLNDQWTWPGREDGCKCTSKPLIDGFDGYTGGKPEGLLE